MGVRRAVAATAVLLAAAAAPLGLAADRAAPLETAPTVAHHPGGRPAQAAGAPRVVRLDTGQVTGEPTIGHTGDGAAFISAYDDVGPSVARSLDGGRSWSVVGPKLFNGRGHLTSLDPYLHVDPVTSRVFKVDLLGSCSQVSWSDDRGETWTLAPLACGGFDDHESLVTGPAVSSTTRGYPRLVYYCRNAVLGALCSTSLDGGRTFLPAGSAAYPTADAGCSTMTGHAQTDQAGMLYLPSGFCGQPMLAISRDEGSTWQRVQVASNGMSEQGGLPMHEASVAVDRRGVIYYGWVARDRLPYLALSRDGGRTWSRPLMVAPPGVNETALPALAVSPAGTVAMAYMGSRNSPGAPFPDCPISVDPSDPLADDCEPEAYGPVTWGGYLTVTTDALARDPLLFTGTVNPGRDPLIRGRCGAGRCKAAADFLDVQLAPDGTPWAVYVDGCLRRCVSGAVVEEGALGVVARLTGGVLSARRG